MERAYLDVDCNYFSSSTNKHRNIESHLFLLCHDYEHPFEKTLFKNESLSNDYLRITAVPLNPHFWEINYFIAENKERQKKLDFLLKTMVKSAKIIHGKAVSKPSKLI